MKVLYTTKDGRMTVELEGNSQAEIWRQIASFQEVFEDTKITKFEQTSDDVRFTVRKDDDDNEYFELRYAGDNPKLFGVKKAFGQNKKPEGKLFPKRKDKEGNYLPDNGWVKYDKEQGKEI